MKNDNKLHCMIIEDNLQAAEIITIFFERNKITSETAENGKIGLKMYFNNPLKYDAIFLDLEMPVMNGYETAKLIRESNIPASDTIPIVAMSGTYTDSGVLKTSLFNYFIKKPFRINSLIGIIKEITKKKDN